MITWNSPELYSGSKYAASLCVPRCNWKLRPECDLPGRKSMSKDEGLWWLRECGVCLSQVSR